MRRVLRIVNVYRILKPVFILQKQLCLRQKICYMFRRMVKSSAGCVQK